MASNDEKGRKLDGRYKQGVDKGAMSSLSIPFPIKPKVNCQPKDSKLINNSNNQPCLKN
mgnify:CR=1 FL=1|jgi:hypothetical protein